MRRAMLAALSVIALALASPGAALAHHGHRGHHHKGKVKAHHARVRFERFGAPTPSSSETPSDTGSEETKTASPTEVVGTVASFENEVLTITLNDGSTVKGKVTSATEIECMTASAGASSTEEGREEDKGSGDDQSGDRDQGSSDEESQSSGEEGQSKEDGGDDDVETAAAEPECGTAALTPGTGVREAELKIGPGGAEFESVELVK
jgi:hypothetical protein